MADRFRLPPRSAGARCFDSGLTIRTSTKLLLEGALVALMYVRIPGRCLPLGRLTVFQSYHASAHIHIADMCVL